MAVPGAARMSFVIAWPRPFQMSIDAFHFFLNRRLSVRAKEEEKSSFDRNGVVYGARSRQGSMEREVEIPREAPVTRMTGLDMLVDDS